MALEHMQVSWVTVYRTHLHRFKKNVISFPQDSVGFFSRFGVLKQYRVGDRVNSFRGPGADVGRSAQLASESSDKVLQAHAVDNLGHVVFGATVSHVFADGTLRLQYDDYSEFGDEAADSVRPRIQMPWHPRFLKDSLIVLLRRNIGHGRVLEGLEVRWSYVCRLMQALTKLGRWRMETSLGPMHKYYDPRLYDILSEEDVLLQHAPQKHQGVLVNHEKSQELRSAGQLVEGIDVRTPAEFLEAGFDLRTVSPVGESSDEPGYCGGDEVVNVDLFCKWLELREMCIGTSVGKWWSRLAPCSEGSLSLMKAADCDTAADLYRRIEVDIFEQARISSEELRLSSESRPSSASAKSPEVTGRVCSTVTTTTLALWLRTHLPPCTWDGFDDTDGPDSDLLVEAMRDELYIVAEHFLDGVSRGTMDEVAGNDDPEEESLRLARGLTGAQLGWPLVSEEPIVPRQARKIFRWFFRWSFRWALQICTMPGHSR